MSRGCKRGNFTEWLQFPLHALILFLFLDFKLKKSKRGVTFHLDGVKVITFFFNKNTLNAHYRLKVWSCLCFKQNKLLLCSPRLH